MRVETYTDDDGNRATARYYLKDTKWSKGECSGECRGEFHGSRCSRANPKYEYRGRMFCGTHHPPRMFERTIKRRVAWNTKYNAQRDRQDWRYAVDAWHAKAEKILRMIADGETNDPVGLAQMYIDERPEEPT